MDTISSREPNNNFLPMAGVIAGALALVLAIVAFVKLSGLNKEIAELRALKERVDAYDSQIGQIASISQTSNETKSNLYNVANQTTTAFGKVSDELKLINGRLEKLEAGRPAGRAAAVAGGTTAGAATAGGAAAQPATAGPDEYIVKSGDTGGKIASANGVALKDLMAVNPDVNWNKMHVGQKIKLPAKK